MGLCIRHRKPKVKNSLLGHIGNRNNAVAEKVVMQDMEEPDPGTVKLDQRVLETRLISQKPNLQAKCRMRSEEKKQEIKRWLEPWLRELENY